MHQSEAIEWLIKEYFKKSMKKVLTLLLMSAFILASDKDKGGSSRDRTIRDQCKNINDGKYGNVDPSLKDYCKKNYGGDRGGSNNSHNGGSSSMRGNKDHGNK